MSNNTGTSLFNLQRVNEGDVPIVSASGCMGSDECHHVEKELRQLPEQKHRRVVLDCRMLTFMTSASLARLLVCGREFRRHRGELKLVGLSTSLRQAAELAGFDRRKDFAADVVTALKAMSQPSEVKPSSAPKQRT